MTSAGAGRPGNGLRAFLTTCLLTIGGCADDMPSDAFAPVPCIAQPAFTANSIAHVTPDDMRTAVTDAASRLIAGFASENTHDLQAALIALERDGAASKHSACRAIRLSRDLLARHEAAAPADADAIRLMLDVAETYYALQP